MTVREFMSFTDKITNEYIYWCHSLTMVQQVWLGNLCRENPEILDADMSSIDFRRAYDEDTGTD